MGHQGSKVKRQQNTQNRRINVKKVLLAGLHGAGKSSVNLALNNEVDINSFLVTIGIDFQIFMYNDIKVQSWDHASRERSRPIMLSHLRGAEGIVFVVDSSERRELKDAFDMLDEYIIKNPDTDNMVVMVLANKQDLEDVMTAEEINDSLFNRFSDSLGNRCIFVMPCTVTKRESVIDAYGILVDQLEWKKKGHLITGFKNFFSAPYDPTQNVPPLEEKMAEETEIVIDTKPNTCHRLKAFLFKPLETLKSALIY